MTRSKTQQEFFPGSRRVSNLFICLFIYLFSSPARHRRRRLRRHRLSLVFASVTTVCLEVGPSAVKHHRFFLEYYTAILSYLKRGAVANRLRRRTSDQTVLGSNPAVAAALSPWTRLFTPIVPRRSLHISFC